MERQLRHPEQPSGKARLVPRERAVEPFFAPAHPDHATGIRTSRPPSMGNTRGRLLGAGGAPNRKSVSGPAWYRFSREADESEESPGAAREVTVAQRVTRRLDRGPDLVGHRHRRTCHLLIMAARRVRTLHAWGAPMAARSLETSIVVRAPRPAVFRWVADYRNAAIALEGVRRWEPRIRRVPPVPAGARFSVRIAFLGVTAAPSWRWSTWDEPAAIGWALRRRSRGRAGTLDVRRASRGHRVTLYLEYEPPGGLLGRFGAARLSGVGRQRLDDGLEAMREAVEGGDG